MFACILVFETFITLTFSLLFHSDSTQEGFLNIDELFHSSCAYILSPLASLCPEYKERVIFVMITYNIYIVIRETGQFSSKGIINDCIGNLNRLTVSRRFTEQAV